MNESNKKRIADINSGIIPEGYKKTKVGILPVEWKTVRLKTISKHSTEKNKDLKYHETYTNSATQGIIKQTDYFDKQISNNENIDGYYIVRQNDYVYNPRISVSAPCGPISKSHFVETGVMSPLYTVFRLNDEYEDNGYIEHYFKSPFWYRYMSSVANYGARHDRMNITNDDLFNMPIPIPPLPEQQKIAEILSTQDKLIELQEKKIEQLNELKKAYLQKMFPKKGSKYPELRFKGFTDAWEQRKVGELTVESSEYTTLEAGFPLLTSSRNGLMYQNEYRGKQTTDSTETMFSIVPLGACTYRHMSDDDVFHLNVNRLEKGLVSREYPVFYASDDNNLDFIVQQINSSAEFRSFCAEQKKGGTRTRLYYKNLCEFQMLIPNTEEQEKIATFLLTLDTLITLHQRKLEQEKEKKKALMQLLLTGKVRCI